MMKICMYTLVKYITTPAVAIALCMLLLGCSSEKQVQDKILSSYVIGFSTPEGNSIWVRKAVFDHRYTAATGSLGCCWEESGAGNSVFDRPLPKHVYIEWIDLGDSLLYSAGVDLADDIYERAMNMPEISSDDERGITKGQIDLVVAMGEKGEVTVWLTNFPYIVDDIRNRVLVVVGQAQATARPWIKPQ